MKANQKQWDQTFISHHCSGLWIDRCEEVSVQFCDEKSTQEGLRRLPLCFSLFPDWLGAFTIHGLSVTISRVNGPNAGSLSFWQPVSAAVPHLILLMSTLSEDASEKAHSSIAMCQFLCVLKLSWNWLLRFYLVDNLVSPLTEIFVGNFFQSVSHLVEQAFANSEWLSLCVCLCLSILLCNDIFWSDLSCLWWMQDDGVLFTNFPPICCPHFISHKMHKIFFGNRAPFVANCQHLRLLGWGANIHLCIPKYLLANFTLWIK